MKWLKAIVCLFFGFLGVHKFMEKKVGMGILYLFTGGLFGIGWIVDIVRCFADAWKGTSNKSAAALVCAVLVALAAKAGMDAPDSTITQENIPSPSPSAVVEYRTDRSETSEAGEEAGNESSEVVAVTSVVFVTSVVWK